MQKWTNKQIELLVSSVLNTWKEQDLLEFKSSEPVVFKRAKELIENEFHKEKLLEDEVYQMMDDIEKKQMGPFDRLKMFPLLKRRLAKEKGLIL